ncbi:phage tail fiber protein [Saccharibacter floricola]|uniref:Phage tail protein n=1 Tax=Saccharibacter floricola DSM 15669 TaxID=1123227 RepID=A0ABQ0NZS3_9PROT|nr:hypothetical protein [Saccharibacter floricola]GBQ07281.1 hypothetical protein AA15669_1313 [Saccharibacter floricola DSM 15669]
MATGLLTSADAVFTLTVQTLFNAPITLENWAAAKGWESQSLKLADTRMSMDGKLNKGFVPSALDMTLHFSPNSNTYKLFDTIATAARQGQTVYVLNGEITLKGLGRKYTLINGVLMEYNAVPNASEMLDDVTVHIRWESILPAGV